MSEAPKRRTYGGGNMAVKLTVALSEEVVDALKEMARENGTSVTETLRRAISTEKWLHDVRKRDGREFTKENAG